jgi:hypothetical protein
VTALQFLGGDEQGKGDADEEAFRDIAHDDADA